MDGPLEQLYPKIGPYADLASDSCWDEKKTEHLIAEYWGKDFQRKNLLQYLTVIQNQYGTICHNAVTWLAQKCQCPLSNVHGLIEFYSFLTQQPAPSFHIYLASNIIEEHFGLREIHEQLQHKLSKSRAKLHLTSCIGLSDQPLSALVNGYAISHLTLENLDEFCQLVCNETPLNQWPEHWFAVPCQLQKPGPLTEYSYISGHAVKQASALSAEDIIHEMQKSGLRGLGGAGFSTAKKWQLCQAEQAKEKYIICNADEGEPGTFKDRYYLTHQLDRVIEGMIIAAKAVSAQKGFIYLRSEYQNIYQHIYNTLLQKRKQGWLNEKFDIELHLGAGAYVCGEESALMESIEGQRGIPRSKPPFPGQKGLFGKPTVINNVETFVCATAVLHQGGDQFAAVGTASSKGSRMLSVSGDCKKPGLYNLPFGTTLQELVSLCEADHVQCIQVGGASGHLFFEDEIHGPFDFASKGCGSSIMIFNKSRSLQQIAQNFIGFFQHESCGFCTPCRVGTQVLPDMLLRYSNNPEQNPDLRQDIEELCHLLKTTSHCGLGKTVGRPVTHYLRGLGRNE